MLLPLTLPPVQKYFWFSRATRPRNSLCLAALSMLIGRILLFLQKASAPFCVKLVHPSLQLTKYCLPPKLWFGWFLPPQPSFAEELGLLLLGLPLPGPLLLLPLLLSEPNRPWKRSAKKKGVAEEKVRSMKRRTQVNCLIFLCVSSSSVNNKVSE